MQWPSNRKFSKRVFLATQLCFVATGVIAYRGATELGKKDGGAEHSHKVLASLAPLRSALREIEVAQRAYLLTGEERFLEPCEEALRIVQRSLSDLEDLVAGDAEQKQSISPLSLKVTREVASFEEMNHRRKEREYEVMVKVLSTQRGLAEMEDIRRRVADLERRENETLRLLHEEPRSSVLIAALASFLGTAINLALLVRPFSLRILNSIRVHPTQEAMRKTV